MKNTFLGLSAIFAFGFTISNAQEIATWAGFRSGAATFTFDDNAPNQVTKVAPVFDKYGYKGSFYLVTKWNPDYNGFQTLGNNGHEIGSHSDSHPNGGTMPDNEIASSKNTIASNIKGQPINTITYPNCNEPNESTLKQHYIGGRTCDGQIQGKTPSNFFKIGSLMTGNTGSLNSKDAFTGKMQEAISRNGWVVFLTHGLYNQDGNGNANYSPTDLGAIDGALGWANQNDSKIWVTTFRNAIMYIKERNSSEVNKKSEDANSITFEITHSIKDNLSDYDYPLSVKIKNEKNWAKVEATQGGANIEASIKDGNIYFDGVPNKGDIVIKNADATPVSSSSEVALESSSSTVNPWLNPSSSFTNPWFNQSSSSVIMANPEKFNLNPISVYSFNGFIIVTNAQEKPITVINSLGKVVRSTKGLGCEQKVFSGPKGNYLVKVGNKTFKISL